MAHHHQQQQLTAIVSRLSLDCTQQDVEKELSPFFDSGLANVSKEGNDSDPSPIMLACQRGHVPCLQYFERAIVQADDEESKVALHGILGHPLDHGKQEGNTPLHYAAMLGCLPALGILSNIGAVPALTLGSQRNSHGDTPLMLAVACGHLEFCQQWVKMAGVTKDIHDTLKLENQSGDSCLSLACGHGQISILSWILQDLQVDIPRSVVDQCRILWNRMNMALMNRPDLAEAHKSKLIAVTSCLGMLETELTRKADLAAAELLAEEPTTTSQKKETHPKKRKPKQKASISPKVESENKQAQFQEKESTPNDELHLTVLEDGTKAVRVQGMSEETSSNLDVLITQPRPQPSTRDMLRDRLQSREGNDVDALMKALCLDVSMLLYTPHGMALDLSPSQLDSIEAILEQQLESVHEARKIQQRMHTLPNDQHATNTLQ
eukprot:Nitzschia sp. Nitz4//scaffold79_size90958//11155//12462//NITZ4_005009-RA/size90958-processed-gene-0.103-mRNA-1//-1//CDS//3329558201//7497//frame0